MSFLTNLIPTNLNEEKEKFFADQTYNPQFVYKNKTDQKKLMQYGTTNIQTLEKAEQILEKAFFNKTDADLEKLEGPLVSQNDAQKTILTYLQMHNLHKKIHITWSSSFIARATMTSSYTLKLRLPAQFRKQGMLGMLHHEIGTHALRRLNQEKQPWHATKTAAGFAPYLPTEEGLASLHGLIPHSFKSAYKSALRYKAVHIAQQNSFAQTWKQMETYIQNPEKRWSLVFRQKRGLTDTSLPGGYSKDLVYFTGLIDMYFWLSKNNFDLTPLYYGKIAYQDVKKAIELNPGFQPQLPFFFSLQKEKYMIDVQTIGKYNEF